MITGLLLAATPTPSPTSTTTTTVDADLVTPGLWGFATLFLLAIAIYFLGRSMARRVRRVNQRARLEEAEAAERAAAEAEDLAVQRAARPRGSADSPGDDRPADPDAPGS